jgi:hypothetical protein
MPPTRGVTDASNHHVAIPRCNASIFDVVPRSCAPMFDASSLALRGAPFAYAYAYAYACYGPAVGGGESVPVTSSAGDQIRM